MGVARVHFRFSYRLDLVFWQSGCCETAAQGAEAFEFLEFVSRYKITGNLPMAGDRDGGFLRQHAVTSEIPYKFRRSDGAGFGGSWHDLLHTDLCKIHKMRKKASLNDASTCWRGMNRLLDLSHVNSRGALEQLRQGWRSGARRVLQIAFCVGILAVTRLDRLSKHTYLVFLGEMLFFGENFGQVLPQLRKEFFLKKIALLSVSVFLAIASAGCVKEQAVDTSGPIDANVRRELAGLIDQLPAFRGDQPRFVLGPRPNMAIAKATIDGPRKHVHLFGEATIYCVEVEFTESYIFLGGKVTAIALLASVPIATGPDSYRRRTRLQISTHHNKLGPCLRLVNPQPFPELEELRARRVAAGVR